MHPRDINEANQLILRKIAEVKDRTILGFLPLSEAEEKSVMHLVRATVYGRGMRIYHSVPNNWRSSPASARPRPRPVAKSAIKHHQSATLQLPVCVRSVIFPSSPPRPTSING